jgi:hypothetical protein
VNVTFDYYDGSSCAPLATDLKNLCVAGAPVTEWCAHAAGLELGGVYAFVGKLRDAGCVELYTSSYGTYQQCYESAMCQLDASSD